MMVAEHNLEATQPSPEGPRRLPCMWYDYAGDPGCPMPASYAIVTGDGALLATCCGTHIAIFLNTIRIPARAMIYQDWWAEQEQKRGEAGESGERA